MIQIVKSDIIPNPQSMITELRPLIHLRQVLHFRIEQFLILQFEFFMSRKEELQQRFAKANLSKQHTLCNQTRVFQELIMFMDYKIRSELKTFTLLSLCGSQRSKFMIDIYLENAFNNLSLTEKVELYEKTIKIAIQIQGSQTQTKQSLVDINVQEDDQSSNAKKEPIRFRVQIQKGFRSWNIIYLNIDGFKVTSQQMNFDLRNYLIRRSKKTDRQCYVVEAIHQSSPETLRFCFLTNNDLKKYLPLFNNLINKGYTQMIKRMYNVEVKYGSNGFDRSASPKRQKPTQKTLRPSQQSSRLKQPPNFEYQPQQYLPNDSHIVQQVLKFPQDQNLSHELSQIIAQENQKYEKYQQKIAKIQLVKQNQQIWHKNIFFVMFPNFNLSQLDNFQRFQACKNQGQHSSLVFKSTFNPFIFKLEMLLNNLQANEALQALTNLPLYKNWHPEILQGQIKLGISSQNSAICYQKHRAYSEWYRQRDYLFLRHVFQMGNDYYIADKSIENTNFIPLNTIHRGRIQHQITKISPSSSGCKIIIQCYIQHGGLLNRHHTSQLTTRYLLGFQKIQQYFSKTQFKKKLKNYLKHQWKVREMPHQESIRNIKGIMQQSQMHDSEFGQGQAVSNIDESDLFFSIRDDLQQSENLKRSVHQLNEAQVIPKKVLELQYSPVVVKTNQEGLVILPNQYLKVYHPMNFIQKCQKKRITPKFKDNLIKDIWKYQQQGGLVLVNKKLKEAQDSVISFILSTLKKNIFSGKGGLNISLPVTIFTTDTNLQRFCTAMSNAPQFLEPAAKSKDPIERFRLCMLYGLTQSLLFIDMEKPFNPILGETYQCHIAGCPVYAQQISHHPPISALLMYGRGYKIHAALEATVNFHINSADGISKGWNHIVFDDGQQICFQTPPAEFQGFSIGDRKFSFSKKGYYFDIGNNLYAQMHFEDPSGMFSSNKWKFKDQVQAQILSVKSQFLNKFVAEFPDKKYSPSSKDILERYSKLSGRWSHDVAWDNKVVYSFNNNLPFQTVPYPYPLHSNSQYRQDLYYRQQNDLARSQIEKQRLQNVQRADRKWREKLGPKAKHH